MDEREVKELLSSAADSVAVSPNLAERAERRYRRRRLRARVLVAAVVVVVVGSGVGLAASIDGGHRGTVVGPSTTTTVPAAIRGTVDVGEIGSLSFVDANEGYGVEWAESGGQRYVVHTTDGGRTWKRTGFMPDGDYSVMVAPQYAGPLDGLVAWGGPSLSQSTDGGAHWRVTLGASVQAVAEASFRLWATVGCETGAPSSCTPRLATSTDAGRTWSPPPTSAGLGRGAQSIAIPSGNTVYVVAGDFAWTPNGGKAWRHHALPAECETLPIPQLVVQADVLLLVCSPHRESALPADSRAFTSEDQGRAWQEVGPFPTPMVTNDAPKVSATDTGFVYARDHGPLSVTTDNGRSWRDAFPMPVGSEVITITRAFGYGVWVAVADQGIWFSKDGTRWEQRAKAPAIPPDSGTGCFKVSTAHPRVIPDPGFDPLTATAAELQAHDFPPRPTNPKLLAAWEGYARKYLAGEVVNCDTPAPSDIPPRYRALATSSHGGAVPLGTP